MINNEYRFILSFTIRPHKDISMPSEKVKISFNWGTYTSSVYVLGCARPKSRENAHVYTYLPYCMCPGLDWLNTREQEILSNCSHFSSSIQIFTSNLSWMDRLEKKNFFFWCCHSFIHSRCKQTLAWGRTRGYAKSHLKNNSSQFARMAISNQTLSKTSD